MPSTLDPITRRHVEKATESLVGEFAGVFAPETINRFIVGSLDQLENSRFSNFLSVLAYRFARERLKALGQADGLIVKEQPEVLFVCVHNAGRSQMAAGLVTLRSEGRIGVRSVGSAPGETINPLVVEAMAELGIDLEEAFPKPLTDEVVRAADVVITMGCGDACPIYPGKRYEDWQVDDPAVAESIENVRAIRDDVDERVQILVADRDRWHSHGGRDCRRPLRRRDGAAPLYVVDHAEPDLLRCPQRTPDAPVAHLYAFGVTVSRRPGGCLGGGARADPVRARAEHRGRGDRKPEAQGPRRRVGNDPAYGLDFGKRQFLCNARDIDLSRYEGVRVSSQAGSLEILDPIPGSSTTRPRQSPSMWFA